MNTLPKWIFANPFPAIHDFESLAVLEQTARLYGAVNELIKEYNKTVEQLESYTKQETANREEFELKITKVIKEFICCMEQKTADLNQLAETIINEALQAGTIKIVEVYNPDTESLDMVVGGEV